MLNQSLLIDIRSKSTYLREMMGVVHDMLECDRRDEALQILIQDLQLSHGLAEEVMLTPRPAYYFNSFNSKKSHMSTLTDFSFSFNNGTKTDLTQDDTDTCLAHYFMNPDRFINVYYTDRRREIKFGTHPESITEHDVDNVGMLILSILNRGRMFDPYDLPCGPGRCCAGRHSVALIRLMAAISPHGGLIAAIGKIPLSKTKKPV